MGATDATANLGSYGGNDTLKEINVEVKRCPDCGARFGIDSAFCPFDGVPLTTATWDRARDPRVTGSHTGAANANGANGASSSSLSPRTTPLTVDDRYEVLEALGEGGMGTVYRVRHVVLNRFFAMKVLRRDLATDQDLAKRFVQEARATAAIKHPNIVAITDFGEMEDGIPYFVMELLEGETLATRIRARGPVHPRTVIRIAKQIADGLVASHAANVIHRDLKPDNVFLVGKRVGKAAEDEIRIVDFGAAKIVGGSKLTRPGIVFGTPYYMSPEQASGQTIDGRADIYSLGILIYEMITGHVPFEADTYMGVLTKHMFQAPAKPIPPSGVQLGELEQVVMRALQKEPEQRYASMQVFVEALNAAEKGRASVPPRIASSPPAHRTVKMHGGNMTAADRIQHSIDRRVAAVERRKRRITVLVAIAGFLALSFTTSVIVVVTSSPPTAAGPPRPMSPAVTSVAKVVATTATAAVMTESDPIPDPSPPSPSAAAEKPTVAHVPAATTTTTIKRPMTTTTPTPTPTPTQTQASPGANNPAQNGRPGEFRDPWTGK